MPITIDISRKLLELKEESGLTFKQIGDIVGSSEANVRRYVMGETKVPDRQLLCAIIRSMDGDPDEVLGKKKPDTAADAASGKQSPENVLYERLLDSMKAAYEKTIESKDNWIVKIKTELDKADEQVDRLEKALQEQKEDFRQEKKKLLIAISVLSAVVLLLILVYFIPIVYSSVL